MTEDLFCKYASNQCSIEERNIVEEWLEKCTDAELISLLQPIWDTNYEKMPKMISDQLWAVVLNKITVEKEVEISITKKYHTLVKTVWKVAACIAFLLIAAYSVLVFKEKPALNAYHKKILSTTHEKVTWTTVNNVEKEHKIISLKDKSVVELFPSSSIRYASDFDDKVRNVYLTGKALFTVAKNKAKPFTVYNDEIATTAVGTRFQVSGDMASGIVSIKLFEGIVKIQSTQRSISGWENGKLLYPGEEVRFENGKAIAKLNVTTERPKNSTGIGSSVNDPLQEEIVFSNSALSEVFETMEKLYGIKIFYKKSDVEGMHLTTTINRKDQASSILNAIAQMNDLRFQKTEEGFKISQLKDNQE